MKTLDWDVKLLIDKIQNRVVLKIFTFLAHLSRQAHKVSL